jgi:hypothetical protein
MAAGAALWPGVLLQPGRVLRARVSRVAEALAQGAALALPARA